MKKVLLTAMAILTVASASVFGMYGRGDSWIDFLVHGNQFRARMDQLGFTLGNGTIKGTFGFRANGINLGNLGNILSGNTGDVTLDSTLSAGIGYTSDAFGIGVGYNFTYVNKGIQVHTPVLMINALNDNLRISIPIQVAVTDKNSAGNKYNNYKYTGVAFNNIQLRYYTGIDAFNAIRFYVYYRNNSYEDTTLNRKYVSESLGFQLRLYFLNTQVGNVTINPYVRLEYHTALKGGAIEGYTAENSYANIGAAFGLADNQKQSDIYDINPYKFVIKPVLGITANSDIVTLYVEPSLGYTATYAGKPKIGVDPKVNHSLAWGAYAELYVRPVQDLEWYFEMDVNNTGSANRVPSASDMGVSQLVTPVYFETTTGITWYLPSFGAEQ
ncbi:cell surface protein [Brachyspira innocens]|uniref:cell surface protein n=1 Tax=Brachyspira innocens TaxID=13264 RepID=UPI0026EC7CF6|nr:cell surface protein [Brachyspira innocens]